MNSRFPTEINVPPEAQPPQPSRQSRRIQGLAPFDPYDTNSIGPFIQDTNTSYRSSNTVASSHTPVVNIPHIPSVSTASTSQFSKPIPPLHSAMSMHMDQAYSTQNLHPMYRQYDTYNVQPLFTQNDKPLFYDPSLQ